MSVALQGAADGGRTGGGEESVKMRARQEPASGPAASGVIERTGARMTGESSCERSFQLRAPVRVGLVERADLEAVLRVHHEVAPQVVEHDCVLAAVELWKLRPDERQRLAVEDPVLLRVNGDHRLRRRYDKRVEARKVRRVASPAQSPKASEATPALTLFCHHATMRVCLCDLRAKQSMRHVIL